MISYCLAAGIRGLPYSKSGSAGAAVRAWEVVGGKPQYLVVRQPGGVRAVRDERFARYPEGAEQMANRLFGAGVRVREITKRGGIVVAPEPSVTACCG